MSTGLIQFPGDPVARHADVVEQVAEIVEAAGRAEPIAPAAYGILCRFLPAVLNPVVEVGTGALRTAAADLAHLVTGLRGTVGAMAGTDQASAARIGSAR